MRLADSFLKAVEAATEDSPLVLVFSSTNVHAADKRERRILHNVARKLTQTPTAADSNGAIQ